MDDSPSNSPIPKSGPRSDLSGRIAATHQTKEIVYKIYPICTVSELYSGIFHYIIYQLPIADSSTDELQVLFCLKLRPLPATSHFCFSLAPIVYISHVMGHSTSVWTIVPSSRSFVIYSALRPRLTLGLYTSKAVSLSIIVTDCICCSFFHLAVINNCL